MSKSTTDKTPLGKYGGIIQQARNEENQKTSEPVSQKTGSVEIKEEEKNISIKVPLSWRQHWGAEAKRQGKTMKGEIIAFLTERYGLPEEK